jgi:hypothetical protein
MGIWGIGDEGERLKNAALNWRFDQADYERFAQDVRPIVDSVPGNLRRLEAFFLYHTTSPWWQTEWGDRGPRCLGTCLAKLRVSSPGRIELPIDLGRAACASRAATMGANFSFRLRPNTAERCGHENLLPDSAIGCAGLRAFR